MTTDLQTKIDRIEAVCREVLELDKAASPGPWFVDDEWVSRKNKDISFDIAHFDPCLYSGTNVNGDDKSFIARARTICPALAQVTLTAIAALRFYDEAFAGVYLSQALQSIADNFPTDL